MGRRKVSSLSKPVFGQVIVVKPFRKLGNGAVGSGRKNSSGKRGQIFYLDKNGVRQPTATITFEASTFKGLSKMLHGKGRVPAGITIMKKGDTFF